MTDSVARPVGVTICKVGHRLLATLLAILFLSAGMGASAQTSSMVSYTVEEGFGSGSIIINARLYRPPGTLPTPAVIVLHGCSGPTNATFDWAERIAGWGYVTIVPDSFGSRDKTHVCNNPMVMLPGARVLDVVAAAEYLASLPFVRRERIALIGFSHGAGTVVDALQQDLSSIGIRGGVAYYPLCIPEKHTDLKMSLLIVIGEMDDWTPAARCRALQQAGLRQPDLAEIIYYPHAYHGFDVNAPSRSIDGADLLLQDGKANDIVQHHVEYNPVAAYDAKARTQALFQKLLK